MLAASPTASGSSLIPVPEPRGGGASGRSAASSASSWGRLRHGALLSFSFGAYCRGGGEAVPWVGL